MQLTNRTIVAAVRAALPAIIAVTLLPGTSFAADQATGFAEVAGGAAAPAGPAECSNNSLRGDYAFTIDGTIFAGPTPILLRGLAMATYDGDGRFTQVDYATFNGIPGWSDWRLSTGTYQVNADCTGSAEIVPPTGPTLNLRLVVFDSGKQVAAVVAGNSTGSLGRRVH